MIDRVHSYHPDCNVVFYALKNENTLDYYRNQREAAINSMLDSNPLSKIDVLEVSAKDDIVSCQTSKAKGGTGTFSCTLAPSKNWKKIISPGSWCLIYMKDQRLTGKETSHLDSGLKMIGIVRSVRSTMEITDTGTKRVRYHISGDDFTSVFKSPIYISLTLSDIAQGKDVTIADAILVLDESFAKANMTPAEMQKAIVNSLLGTPALVSDNGRILKQSFRSRGGQPYLVPSELTKRVLGASTAGNFFTEMIVMFLQSDLVGTTALQSGVGSMISTWSLMEHYANRMVNELYTDLLPVYIDKDKGIRLAPSVVFRAIPFSSKRGQQEIGHSSLISMQDSERFSRVTVAKKNGSVATSSSPDIGPGRMSHFYISKVIEDHEVLAENSGKSDAERFNFFYVTPNFSILPGGFGISENAFIEKILDKDGMFGKILNKVSVARYGLRPYMAHSDYMINDTNAIGIMNSIVRDIWEPAYLFENGQVTIKGSGDHIPVGTNVLFVSDNTIAHVERVDNSFSVDAGGTKTFRTTISFIRRQKRSSKDDVSPNAVQLDVDRSVLQSDKQKPNIGFRKVP